MILLLAGLASGGTYDAWSAVGDAQVLEALGEDRAAGERYQQLSRQLAGDDSTRAEALYRLGQVLLRLGDIDGASRAFDDCVRIRAWRARCLHERTEVEIGRSAVRTLPTRWTFDDTAHGLIHPFSDESGSIRIGLPEGQDDPALLWTDDPNRGDSDSLLVGFDLQETAPAHLRFEASAIGDVARLRVRAEDRNGRLFSTAQAVPLETLSQIIDVTLTGLIAEDGGAGLDPRQLYRVHLVDERNVTGANGAATLIIDTFEVW